LPRGPRAPRSDGTGRAVFFFLFFGTLLLFFACGRNGAVSLGWSCVACLCGGGVERQRETILGGHGEVAWRFRAAFFFWRTCRCDALQSWRSRRKKGGGRCRVFLLGCGPVLVPTARSPSASDGKHQNCRACKTRRRQKRPRHKLPTLSNATGDGYGGGRRDTAVRDEGVRTARPQSRRHGHSQPVVLGGVHRAE